MSIRSKQAPQSINSLVAKLGVLSQHATHTKLAVPCLGIALAVSYSAQIPTTDMG
jgi:hypothetical protein